MTQPNHAPTAFDLLLKGGRLIDPLNGIDRRADVAIADGRVAAVGDDLDPARAERIVDASRHIVTPGLIDMHAHVYHTRAPEGAPEGLSIVADAHSFRSGVTTMVDTGTAGARHFPHFKATVIDRAKTRILAYVNVVAQGMMGEWENDVANMDPELAASVVLAHPDVCVGIKTAHYWTRGPWDAAHPPWAAVDRAIEAARLCAKPVMYDVWPRPPERSFESLILDKARPGDVLTHVFGQPYPIILDDGALNPALLEARAKGVIFDVGHGAASFYFRNAAPAVKLGFVPDSISTDLHIRNVHGVVVDMLTTMNKFLAMGVPLPQVIAMATAAPAREIGHPELGHLSVGAVADVAVLSLQSGEYGFIDCGRARLRGSQRLECAMTLRAGNVVFDIGGLSMPDWEHAPASYFGVPLEQALRPAAVPTR